MSVPSTKAALSAAQTALIRLLQDLNFGRIEGLHVRDGEPTFVPPPRVVRKLKIGGDNASRVEANLTDFRLKHQVMEMLEALGKVGDGHILSIEVKGGLPFTMEIEQPLCSAEGQR